MWGRAGQVEAENKDWHARVAYNTVRRLREEILHTRMVETLRDVLRLIIVGSHHLRLLLFPTDARLLRCALLHPKGRLRAVESALVA